MLAGKCLVYIKHVWNEPQVEKCFNPLKPDVHYLVMNCYEQIGYCMQEWNSLQKNWTDLACPRPSPRKKQMPAGHFPKHSTAAWITPKPKPHPPHWNPGQRNHQPSIAHSAHTENSMKGDHSPAPDMHAPKTVFSKYITYSEKLLFPTSRYTHPHPRINHAHACVSGSEKY